MTHTYAELEVSQATYDEIFRKLNAAGYQHAFMRERDQRDPTIDMHGIGLTRAVVRDVYAGRVPMIETVTRVILAVLESPLLADGLVEAQIKKACNLATSLDVTKAQQELARTLATAVVDVMTNT